MNGQVLEKRKGKKQNLQLRPHVQAFERFLIMHRLPFPGRSFVLRWPSRCRCHRANSLRCHGTSWHIFQGGKLHLALDCWLYSSLPLDFSVSPIQFGFWIIVSPYSAQVCSSVSVFSGFYALAVFEDCWVCIVIVFFPKYFFSVISSICVFFNFSILNSWMASKEMHKLT